MNNDRVYLQTNDAAANQVIAYRRESGGKLSPLGAYGTGGLGTGQPHLPSQGSVVLTEDGARLLVSNAGSDDVSVLTVGAGALELVDRAESGGAAPQSIAVHGSLVYVLNNGGGAARPA